MSKRKEKFICFWVGAVLYALIELLWRGYTHWSMLLAGGISFVGMGDIGQRFKKCSILIRSIIGGAFITAIELIFGIVFNIFLKKKVWDYSKLPFNFKGQICLKYSCFWALLCLIAMPLYEAIKRCFNQKKGTKKSGKFS